MELSKRQVTESLQRFKASRDALLHEDEGFDHNLHRFVEFCQSDPLVQSVLQPLLAAHAVDAGSWWRETCEAAGGRVTRLQMPADRDEELALEYRLLELADSRDHWVLNLGVVLGKRKNAECVNAFLVMIVRPFVDELSRRLGEAASLATPEERALQAVPLARLPGPNEVRIFLSHKSVDKPVVYRYYQALKEVGFDPWLDEEAMPAGTNLERGLFQGFQESCAAVFFITESFRDEKYLAAEVDYAVMQKRRKGAKFSIITLRYSNAVEVPGLLTPYIYKTVANDLDGFRELVRALPIELGPVRWKAEVVEEE